MADKPEPSFFSDKQLSARYSISRVTLWRWCERGDFPQPIKLSSGCTRWRSDDVAAWEAQRGGE